MDGSQKIYQTINGDGTGACIVNVMQYLIL